MKEQNPDIPFVVHRKYKEFRLGLGTDAQIDALLLDPRGILVEYAGSYKYISKTVVANAIRILRDRRKLALSVKPELMFNAQMGDAVWYEVGRIIETMSTELKTLQKKYDESYPEATSSG